MGLALAPALGAISAGCPVVIKPSELCPEVSKLIATLVPRYLDPHAVLVSTGGIEVSKALLELRWDNILFTGSERVGKIVAAAAATHLTPYTLELGGKCPVLVGPQPGDLNHMASKLLWGRFANCGQTCVAPEYVLVPEELLDPLANAITAQLEPM